jgi:hypothetical protein
MLRRSLWTLTLAGVIAAALIAAPRASDPPPILVSRQLAESEHLAAGQVVQLAPDVDGRDARPFRIVGIYEPTPNPARLGTVPREVRLHLSDLLALARATGERTGDGHVDTVNVRLTDGTDAAAFARDLGARLPGVMAEPTGRAGDPPGPFRVLRRFHFAIAIVTITASTAFLLALTIMLVDERRETIGMLRLIGLPVRRVLFQLVIEGLLVASAGAAIGLVLAVASEGLINRFFQWRYDTALVFVRITPHIALECVLIAVPLGATATVVASWALLRRSTLRLARR